MTEKPSIYRLLAVAGFEAYGNSLAGPVKSDAADYFHRARQPKVGDLVVEHTTLWMPNWNSAALGWLLEIVDEPVVTKEEHDAMLAQGDYWQESGEDYDSVPTGRVYYIDPLDPDITPRPYRWYNAGFVAIPTEIAGFKRAALADSTEGSE